MLQELRRQRVFWLGLIREGDESWAGSAGTQGPWGQGLSKGPRCGKKARVRGDQAHLPGRQDGGRRRDPLEGLKAMLRNKGFEGLMWSFPRRSQMSLLPSPAAVCFVGFLQEHLRSFPVPLRSKHTVLRCPVAKIRLSKAGGVGIRVSLRTGLAVSLWPGVKFSLRPALGFSVRSGLGFV